MRGKRSKQYRKLMQQYSLHFNFREPYQVILDGAILEDAARFKMDFVSGLSKALHGQIKPMLTTCTIRHLSHRNPQDSPVMQHARHLERRRCNHHSLPEPLSEFNCIRSVVDPKDSKTNKFRLVVASQDEKLRTVLRGIPGVPMVYIKRSVMVMEPMGAATEGVVERGERGKMREGLRGVRGGDPGAGLKRKREEVEGEMDVVGDVSRELDVGISTAPAEKKRRKVPGAKKPNPLSVKKAKAKNQPRSAHPAKKNKDEGDDRDDGEVAKKKRKRKHKSGQPAVLDGADAGEEPR